MRLFEYNLIHVFVSIHHCLKHTMGSRNATMAEYADLQKQLSRVIWNLKLDFSPSRLLSDDMSTLGVTQVLKKEPFATRKEK